MKTLSISIIFIFFCTGLFAQHQHQHKPAEPVKKQIKKTTKPRNTSQPVNRDSSSVHSHIVDDSILVVHDKDHNEISEKKIRKDTVPVLKQQHVHADTFTNHDMMDHGSQQDMQHDNMSHAFSRNLPMNRNGSGTGWLPDASPMYGYMFHTPTWMYMLHGNIFLRYNNQDFQNKGLRGDAQFDAPNWIMFMGQRNVGAKGLFHFNTMFSFDAAVTGGNGYPLLFQSGELYRGQPLVDRQHPHDLFSELSVSYAHALSGTVDLFAYLAYPGEPALGPVAFMHRPSSLYNPDAPISHHWVDATHITFGVATLGLRAGKFKLEGSSFTGREPDEKRFGFDEPRFDSWSGRISFNPTSNWALQVSSGFLNSPEIIHPGEDVNRTTASAIYSKPIQKGTINAAAVWGMNKRKGHDGENAVLVEGSLNINRSNFYAKYEFVEKSVEELVLDEDIFGHDAIFPVHAATLGFNYDILKAAKSNMAAGAQFTYFNADSRLNGLYGKNPMAFEIYLRLYPGRMR